MVLEGLGLLQLGRNFFGGTTSLDGSLSLLGVGPVGSSPLPLVVLMSGGVGLVMVLGFPIALPEGLFFAVGNWIRVGFFQIMSAHP